MEITKQNETFNLKDTTDNGWTVTGSATNNTDGSLSVYFNVTAEGSLTNNIGYYNITIPTEGMVNVNLSAMPDNYNQLIDYSQEALKIVQDYLKNQTITK